jgi:TonB family protein
VLAVKNEDGMKALLPQAWEQKDAVHPASILVTGPDRHYIALRADIQPSDREGTVNPYNSAYWSYASLILRSGLKVNLPVWLTIGIADVMSNINVTNSTVKVGEVIPWHVRTLHSVVHRPRLSELVNVEGNSSWLTGTERPMFDAVAWAFVHYLMFGEQGAHAGQLNKFIALLLDGKRSNEAFTQAFGDIDSFTGPFTAYLNRPIWSYARINADAKAASEDYPTRTLSAAETGGLRSAFHVSTSRFTDARAALDRLRLSDAKQPVLADTEGLLDDAERKPEDARAAFGRAMDLGSTNFYPYYRWATLSQPSASDDGARAKVEQSLARSVDLNGRFSPAQSMLAFIRLQRGHADEALTAAQQAVALQSDDVNARIILVSVLTVLGRRDVAQREAAAAMPLAKSDAQRQQLQRLLATLAANAPAPNAVPARGTGAGPATSNIQATTADAGGVYQSTGEIVAPRLVRNVSPSYTPEGLQQKIQGVVVVSGVVNTDGSFTDLKVVRSLDTKYGLDEEALKAARQWLFTPGTLKGVPVRVSVSIEMSFTLK